MIVDFIEDRRLVSSVKETGGDRPPYEIRARYFSTYPRLAPQPIEATMANLEFPKSTANKTSWELETASTENISHI